MATTIIPTVGIDLGHWSRVAAMRLGKPVSELTVVEIAQVRRDIVMARMGDRDSSVASRP